MLYVFVEVVMRGLGITPRIFKRSNRSQSLHCSFDRVAKERPHRLELPFSTI